MTTTTTNPNLAAGRRLRGERERQQLALLAVATRAGCSTSTLLAVERYGFVPRASTRARIAGALSVPVTAIWPQEGAPSGD